MDIFLYHYLFFYTLKSFIVELKNIGYHRNTIEIFNCFQLIHYMTEMQYTHLPGSLPQQDLGEPSGWTASVREDTVRQSLGLSLKIIFALSLYTLNNIFFGEVHTAYTKVSSKHYSNLTFNRNRMSPTYFSFMRVFFITWPSGLLTFYGLHLVWLKQLQ